MRLPRALLLTLLLTLPASAQFWPLPNYTTPDTPVTCSQCQQDAAGMPTPGWHDPVVRYVGRFVSSEYVGDFQQAYRTARAGGVVFSPDGSRIAIKLGQGIATYSTASFLARLDAHEELVDVGTLGVSPCNRALGSCDGTLEKFLAFERYFYAEKSGSGWSLAFTDGQDRLGLFDLDDRGLIYVGYDQFGWGIASDLPNTVVGNKLMSSWQDKNSFNKWAPAQAAFWIKDGADYYALALSTTSGTTTHVFKVPTYATVTEIAPFPKVIRSLARSGNRTAIITDSAHLYVYDNHALVTGGAPLQTFDFTGSGMISNVVSDGASFWVSGLSLSSFHMMLTKIAPSGATYTRTDTLTPYGSAQPGSLQYKDGYISVVTNDSDGLNIRLYNVSNGSPMELPAVQSISNYFKNVAGFAPHTAHMTIWSATPLVSGGKLYLIVNGDGIGDVYQIRAGGPAPPQTYSISGTSGISGATVTAGSQGATSDASNNYTVSNLANGTYTVTPSKSGCTFTPASQSVSVSGANVTGVNFTASCTAKFFTISGNTGTSGAVVSAASSSTTSDAAGNFSMSGFTAGNYTVTPSKQNCAFSPASSVATITSANAVVNFAATCSVPPVCKTLLVNQNVFLDYSGASSTCRTGGACVAGEMVNFNVSYWNYNSTCATHTYAWRIDGVPIAASDTAIAQSFATGQHLVACTVSNGVQAVTLTVSLSVTGTPVDTSKLGHPISGDGIPANTWAFSVQGDSAARYVWDFGDGTVVTGGPVQTHTYGDGANHTVSVHAVEPASVISYGMVGGKHRGVLP